MTISKADMLANEALALRLIGEYCAGAAIGEEHEKDLEAFRPILATTWKALADAGYIRLSIRYFQITPSGWIKALEASGKLCDPQMKRDLGLICAALKKRLERSNGPAGIAAHEVVSETGLPHYWVVNVINSHLIRYCLKRVDADWVEGHYMESLIEVPIDFGHPL